MKRIASILLLLGCSVTLWGQDFQKIFEEFQQSAQQQMQQFQEKTREEFYKTLADQWNQFHVNEAVPRPAKPKPTRKPVAPPDIKPEDVDVPVQAPEDEPLVLPELTFDPFVEEEIDVPDLDPLAVTNPHVDPIKKPEPSPAILVDLGGKKNTFAFYSMPVGMAPLTSLQGDRKPHLADITEKQVAKFWRALENSSKDTPSFASQVLPVLDRCRKEYDLNDWTLYRLVVALVGSQWDNSSEQAVVQVFLLNHLGLDARIGRVNDHLSLMFPAKQMVYACPFITISGKKFFVMDEGKVPSVFTYAGKYSDKVEDVELTLVHSDRIFDITEPRIVKKNLPTLQKEVALPVSQSRCDFYLDYPQLPVEEYARCHVNEAFSSSLLKQLRFVHFIEDKGMAVSALMRCIQMDFNYATDQEQFGYEKPFFLEEDFLYPKNDCEDRSILLAFLVKHLLNLDIVLLDYPQHIATAVCFGDLDVPGAHLEYNGKKYVICDPTYIGADPGMVMPQYKDTPAKVL